MSEVYHRTAELLEAEVGDELVALDAEAGRCFGFNEVATSVWRSLEQPKSFDQLRDQLLNDYEVERDECIRDLHELLETLLARGLVKKSVAAGNYMG
jgi:hypothetical protein